MEIYDKEKEIGYAVHIAPIEYDENGNAINLQYVKIIFNELDESYEDAREKVKAAYLKHNDCFDLERDVVEINEIAEDDSWFSDNPDVIEIDELVQEWRNNL